MLLETEKAVIDTEGMPFRYCFLAYFALYRTRGKICVCTCAGTYFWHDHASALRADGLTGPLIIMPAAGVIPAGSPAYDAEETLFVQDWFHAQGVVQAYSINRCAYGSEQPTHSAQNGTIQNWDTDRLVVYGSSAGCPLASCGQYKIS